MTTMSEPGQVSVAWEYCECRPCLWRVILGSHLRHQLNVFIHSEGHACVFRCPFSTDVRVRCCHTAALQWCRIDEG